MKISRQFILMNNCYKALISSFLKFKIHMVRLDGTPKNFYLIVLYHQMVFNVLTNKLNVKVTTGTLITQQIASFLSPLLFVKSYQFCAIKKLQLLCCPIQKMTLWQLPELTTLRPIELDTKVLLFQVSPDLTLLEELKMKTLLTAHKFT